MVKQLVDNIKSIEKYILSFMFLGINFAFLICVISSLVLLFYILNPISYLIFDAGIIIFKTSLKFAISFFIGAIVINNLKKEIG